MVNLMKPSFRSPRLPLTVLLISGAFAAQVFGEAAVATLRPGDTFDLKLGSVPLELAQEFNTAYTVGQEGTINVPLIREVKVAGFTPPQVEKLIQTRLVAERVFTTPSVNINTIPNSRFVIIGGGVRNPQRVVWAPDLTALGAIQLAGGPGEFNGLKDLKLIRAGKVAVFDGRKFESSPSTDPRLLPGDLIIVK